MLKQAQLFADRLRRLTASESEQIEAAYNLGLGRTPTTAEAESLRAYAQKYSLANACRLLLNLNEFVFLD